jgi:hypothetical protein
MLTQGREISDYGKGSEVDETCSHKHKVSQAEEGYAITDWLVCSLID